MPRKKKTIHEKGQLLSRTTIRQMQEQFANNLFIYRDPKEAALKAGYSKSTSYGWKSIVARSEHLQGLIRKHAKGGALLQSILFDELVGKVTHSVLEDMDAASTMEERQAAVKRATDAIGKLSPTHKAQLLESERLRPEQTDKPATIQINSVRQLMVQVNALRRGDNVSLLPDKKISDVDNDNDIIDLESDSETQPMSDN